MHYVCLLTVSDFHNTTRCDNINVTEVRKGKEEKCDWSGCEGVVKKRMDRAGAAHVESNAAVALIKNRFEKMVRKVMKTWSAGERKRTRSWVCRPLKREKEAIIRQSDHQTLTRTRPGVPDGTVADTGTVFPKTALSCRGSGGFAPSSWEHLKLATRGSPRQIPPALGSCGPWAQDRISSCIGGREIGDNSH